MRKLCPNCDALLKVDAVSPHTPVLGHCTSCGWTGPIKKGRCEPTSPSTPPRMPYVSIDIETTGLDPATCQILEVGAVIDDWMRPIDQLPRFRRVLTYDTVSGNPYAMSLNSNLLKLIANAPKDPAQPVHEAAATWAGRCAIKQDVGPIATMLFGANPYLHWWSIPNHLLSRRPTAHDLLDLAANPPGTSCLCQPQELSWLFHSWIATNGLDPLDLQAAGKNFAAFDMQFLTRLPGFSQNVKFRHRVLDPAILFWHPLEDERLPDSKTCYERAGLDNKVTHTAVEDALAVVRLVRMGVKRLAGMQ